MFVMHHDSKVVMDDGLQINEKDGSLVDCREVTVAKPEARIFQNLEYILLNSIEIRR
jgi:hypothetical protein